jgi:hypothetical protein
MATIITVSLAIRIMRLLRVLPIPKPGKAAQVTFCSMRRQMTNFLGTRGGAPLGGVDPVAGLGNRTVSTSLSPNPSRAARGRGLLVIRRSLDNEVALVLAVFIVNQDNHSTGSQLCDRVGNGRQLKFCH